jgi:hypothetical protein
MQMHAARDAQRCRCRRADRVFVYRASDSPVVSTHGTEFNHVASHGEDLYRDGRRYVLHPSVTQSKHWSWIANALAESRVPITLEWLEGKGIRSLACE